MGLQQVRLSNVRLVFSLSAVFAACVSRIRKGYEWRFRCLLREFGARRVEQGVRRLFEMAEEEASKRGTEWGRVIAEINLRLLAQLTRHRNRIERQLDSGTVGEHPPLVCDAGLGGLARWLRACGQRALWEPGISDDRLLELVRRVRGVLLSTDSMLVDRRVIRAGVIRLLWLPPDMPIADQLLTVMLELGLKVLPPRCMSCGGELVRVPKAEVSDRIPPKTYRWKDDYFLCAGCNKLFWEGSHWERITSRLRRLGLLAGEGIEQSDDPRPV